MEQKQTRGEVLPGFWILAAWVRSDAGLSRVEVVGDRVATHLGDSSPRDLDSIPGDECDRAQASDRVVRDGCRRRRAAGAVRTVDDDASLLVRPDHVSVHPPP